jgi:hypothetical protein
MKACSCPPGYCRESCEVHKVEYQAMRDFEDIFNQIAKPPQTATELYMQTQGEKRWKKLDENYRKDIFGRTASERREK